MLPKYHLSFAVGHEGHSAVLGDDDGQTVGVIVDEAVGGAVARADIFDVFCLANLAFGVHGAEDLRGRREFSGHFCAEAKHPEALVEDERAVDGGKVRKHAAVLE